MALTADETDQMKCKVCNKRFVYLKSLKKHIAHCAKSSIVCHVCGETFQQRSDYKKHKAIHSNTNMNVQNFQCDLCFVSFKRMSTLQLHMVIHSDYDKSSDRCTVCHKTFRKDYLLKHMQVHTPENDERVQCQKCGVHVKKSYYNEHLQRHFLKNIFECSVCHKRFKSLSELNIHYNIHTGDTYNCELCNFHCTIRSKLRAHMLKHVLGKHVCSKCQKVYKRRKDLTRHLKIHDNRPSYRCYRCGRAYRTLFWLRNHEQGHSDTEKKYQCDQCQRSYFTKQMLKLHMSCHKKPFICGICSRSFRRELILTKHMTVHTNGNLCHICNKTFRCLAVHMSKHQRQTVYKCEECNCVSFNLKTYKDACKHVQEKLPRCQLCRRIFLSDHGLKLHVKKYQKSEMKCYHARKLKCQECKREFSDKLSYRQHKESHDPNKQFCCEYCHERFYSFTKLYKHLGTHNG